jgi:hypothetical protein
MSNDSAGKPDGASASLSCGYFCLLQSIKASPEWATLAHAVGVATSCLPGPRARAAGEVKLTAARFYQRITSNLEGRA